MKYIPLEDIDKIFNARIKLADSYYERPELEETFNFIKELPTIDPIQIIDEMINEVYLHDKEGHNVIMPASSYYSIIKRTLQELKSRLSLTK